MADANPDIPVDPHTLLPRLAQYLRGNHSVLVYFQNGVFVACDSSYPEDGEGRAAIDRELGRALDKMLDPGTFSVSQT